MELKSNSKKNRYTPDAKQLYKKKLDHVAEEELNTKQMRK